eukprot:g2039.t1
MLVPVGVADARGGGGSGSGGRGRQGQGAGAGPPDAVLRITYPMDLRPAPHGVPTWVFGTTELQLPLHEMRGAGSPDWSELHKLRSHVGILTPSGWSAHGFRNGGVHASRLRIVPHGVDPRIFRPASPARRRELRAARGWTGHAVFLTVGSRAGSKGIPDLIRAFRGVHEAHPHAKLVLKLADGVYNSSAGHGELRRSATLLASGAIEYVGESLSFSRMAELYQAADAYVSPYRGEGFNIPVLEAAACGLPVVVTRGGATEDYILDSFALRVSSELAEVSVGDGGDGASPRQGRHPAVGEAAARQMGRWLLPNPEHLRVQMVRAMHDEELVARARREAPKHVHSRFSWAAAVDRLVAALRESVQNSRRKRGAQRGEEDESETCIE